MRLLEQKPNGELFLREFTGDAVPAYAILSHTWGPDGDEVSFQDVEAGTGKGKPGYRKLLFCAERAAADGLRYFWVDTCCIDKKNAVELGAAINSMFRWYQKAARCYVYLPDVSIADHMGNDRYAQSAWEPALRQSRWFTRGWTLQELIAPTSVQFFTSKGQQLGSKKSLQTLIHEITGIAETALGGSLLSDFSVDERMSWAVERNTKLEEDQIYSLFGIFGVSMPLIYGEGKERALRRLQREIEESSKAPGFEEFAVELSLSSMPESVQFVAREQELAEMHRLLHGRTSQSTVVLHGLGGIGKTQLAMTYTRRHKAKYTAIFWLNANDQTSLKQSFVDIAQRILRTHPSVSMLASVDLEGNLDNVVEAVKAWLEISRNTRWLIIYDNYDNPKVSGNTDVAALDIRQFLPISDHGSIVVTTRSSKVTIGPRIHVQKLRDIHDGLEILSNTSGRKGIGDDATAIALVEELDGLPLALSTAGAYLEQVTTSFTDYLRLYKASWLKLQITSPQLQSYENRSLYSTWQLSFDQIKRQNELSAKLLKLWAYFDRQDVWYELLRNRSPSNSEWISQLTQDEFSFNEAVRVLCSYGLVDPHLSLHEQVESRGYSMHSCVHSWTICVLNKEWDEELAKIALYCTASMVPERSTAKWWLTERRLLQHAQRCSYFIVNGLVRIKEMEWAMQFLGFLYANQGKLTEAEGMYVWALQGYEETLGLNHLSTLETVNNLGNLYADQGKFVKAEEMYIRALQVFEEALGLSHPSALKTANNLAVVYENQGKFTEAEEMYVRVLQGKEEVLGMNHPSTFDTANNLGALYVEQGRLAKAEEMYIRALQGEEAVGLNHPSMLVIANNLGNLYQRQGKLTEAEKMYLRVLQGKEATVGLNHISTLKTVNNLGILYKTQGKLTEAENMYVRAIKGYEEALGPSLVSSYVPALKTLSNLGDLYSIKHENDMARKMYTKALCGFTTVQGPSSDMCRRLQDRLAALDLSASQEGIQDVVSERSGKGKSVSTMRKFISKLQK